MRLRRRRVFLTIAGWVLNGSRAGRWLRSEAESLETVRLQRTLPNLDRPIRLLQLSDWHASPVVRHRFLDHAVQLALAEQPDLICLTGDFTTDGLKNWDPLLASLRELTASAPTFGVLGNHDGSPGHAHGLYEKTVEVLDEAGVVRLENRSVRPLADASLQLVGTGDFWHGPFAPAAAFAELPADHPTVVLTHNPDAQEVLLTFPWHLCLCGHTHGGQINLPGMFGRFAPVRDRRFIAGEYVLEPHRRLYINRGLGSIGGLRWGARPEMTVFELQPERR